MNEETEQIEETGRSEVEEPALLLECPLSFSLREQDGTEPAHGAGEGRLDEEALSIQPALGEALRFPLRDILRIWEGDYEVHLAFTSNEELVLRDLGYRYEDFLNHLSKQRNEVLLKDMLMDESVKVAGMGAHFVYLDESGQKVAEGQCEPRLYETGLVILPERGDPVRFPYGDIVDFSAEDYLLTISTEFAEKVVLSQMGRQFDSFCKAISEAMNALSLKVQSALKELLPQSDPAVIRRASRLMREGRAASKHDIEAISPQLWKQLESRLEAYGIKDTYDFLRSLSQEEQVCIGVKRGLMGDLTGEYVWFLIPIYSADPAKPGNAIAMEAASEENGGKATYFFRMVGRGEYSDLGGLKDMGERALPVIKKINRCMLAVNFRREPIYLPEEKLDDPRYSRYRFSIQRLPALQDLRRLLIGRVIHATPEQWKKDVADLLKFNTASSSDDDKWKKGKGAE